MARRDCEWCGEGFTPKTSNPRARFCGTECAADWQSATLRKVRICARCGAEFRLARGAKTNRKTCSDECLGQLRGTRDLCKRGHDTKVVGRSPSHACRECERERDLRRHATDPLHRARLAKRTRRYYERWSGDPVWLESNRRKAAEYQRELRVKADVLDDVLALVLDTTWEEYKEKALSLATPLDQRA